mmetsp:Transcript_10519/g.27327  ORF Transcript_10519/g.27327 Transcript_10519/m.27327 type:complete len:295 (-) Transcript_10519:2-886(-)
MGDDLFSVKNEFFLGNYQGAINEAQSSDLVLGPADEKERDIIVYRCYIELGQSDVVQSEINDSHPTALQAVKLLSTYKTNKGMAEMVLVTVKQWLEDAETCNNPTLQLVSGLIFMEEGEYEEAAKALHAGTTLEMVSLQVQCYLKMARVDMAEKSASLMARMEDDATLTQLTTAWVNMSLGGDKLSDAFYTFQELADKYSETPLLLNGMAACKMHQGQYEEAEKYLLKALAKSSTDALTLQNLVVCAQHTRKAPEVVSRYLATLGRTAGDCLLLKRKGEWEAAFDKAAAGLASS